MHKKLTLRDINIEQSIINTIIKRNTKIISKFLIIITDIIKFVS